MTGTLRARTAISVGSAASYLPSSSDLLVIKGLDGLPLIPGSSIKGVVRSYLERLARTASSMGLKVGGEEIWACDPLDKDASCVRADDKRRMWEESTREATEELSADAIFYGKLWERSCTVCRIFGHQYVASRVCFFDARLSNADRMPVLFEVRDGVGIDRETGKAKDGIKYDFEVVPKGAEFELKVVAENLEDWEMGMLLLALEAMGRGEVKIGGKSSRGIGWCEVLDLKIRDYDLLDLLTSSEGKEASNESFLSSFRAAIGS